MLENITLDAASLEDEIRRGKELLLELLQKNGGSVGTRRVREELAGRGFGNPGEVIAHLKFLEPGAAGEVPPFHHHGRSFYTPEAFRKLMADAESAAESRASEVVAAGPEEEEPEPRRRENRKEEARLGGYVVDALKNLYATDFGPDRDWIFDVHNLRPGSEYENVDLLAVHWRTDEIVELVAVEVKLAFTAKLVQQANNYRRFANRVWIAVLVEAPLVDASSVLRELDPLLFEHTVELGLGILGCRRAKGRSYEVGVVQWPRRVEPDPVEHATFLERFRDTFEAAGVLAPRDLVRLPKTR